ncbi:sulfate adenylyltransferase [Natronospora cellulosivora (SeqCode)]
MINAHGGKLVDRIVRGEERVELLARAKEMPQLVLRQEQLAELENIATGLYSPIEGFLDEMDYYSVLNNCRLRNGVIWSVPIVLGVSNEEASSLKLGEKIALKGEDNIVYAILNLEDKYIADLIAEAEMVYRSIDEKHPGVAKLYQRGEVLLAGRISLLNRINYSNFLQYRMDPAQVREVFKEKSWKTIVGFQTRNPIHRAHEYIQKCALEICDGLLLSPLVGETKKSDIPVEFRIKSYQVVMENIYPKDRIHLTVYPANMRYAGPREAIFHALCRKNYGCTHFIVGRDHAGVGNYYGTYDAQNIFDNFTQKELGIIPLKFEHSFYCKKCDGMASKKTCPHNSDYHLTLSGTKVRSLLQGGKRPPIEITRPEVVDVLIEAYGHIS